MSWMWSNLSISLLKKCLSFFPAGEPGGDNASPIGIYDPDSPSDPYGKRKPD